jgi:hypothetical protein
VVIDGLCASAGARNQTAAGLCASKRMTFVDAIGSPEGPIVIFRCPDCKKLLWEKQRRDEK